MKTLRIALISFVAGSLLTGLVALKFAMGFSYQMIMSSLHEHVFFYEQLEQGNLGLVQKTISGSLEWYILMAEDGEASVWVSTSENDRALLKKAKQLQTTIKTHSVDHE